ncbi:hypothetical protein Poly51_28440 [Rubripirellula tenax]|uniref:Uncharacterized protein n=1 Tax=Rubripirellula tenax TaxID=2528015 RepID=A0A5C6F9U1_9BACT|nr:hypothetical protein [Rubripirellula tenax]TWU56926.1 hypothetical protein Poly51_28440 [Rubripirellula tenax]
MARVHQSVVAFFWSCIVGSLLFSPLGHAEPIGWIERYALAEDRQSALDELIPGTDDYYFFHCLHYQTTAQFEKAEAILAEWAPPHLGQPSATVKAMIDRQRLLTYDQSPQRTIDHLVRRLGIQLNHAPPATRHERRYPSELDETVLDVRQIIRDAITRSDALKPSAINFLADRFVRDEAAGYAITLDRLLDRIQQPTIENLGQLVIKELKSRRPNDRKFGNLHAHRVLTLDELKAVAKNVAEVGNDEPMVTAILARLRPGAEVDLSVQPDERLAYLTRVENYAQSLPPSYNSLKASAAFRLLEANLSQSKFDRDLFLRYLALPRFSDVVLPRWNEQQIQPADLNRDFMGMALLPPIGNDEAVVRAHLEHFLRDADSTQAFDAYLKRKYLSRVFAETKLLAGVGDEARWYPMLSEINRQTLRDSVELRLSPTNPLFFSPKKSTRLAVELKNVDELVVRIYQINVPAYHRSHDKPLDTDIDLDGLVATHETKLAFNHPAIRRHREDIELPQIAGRGVWVVDLIGKGIRGRAMVRRGSIDHVVTTVADGLAMTVIDENREPLSGASVSIGSRHFTADETDSRILIPLASKDTRRKAIISDGVLAESIDLPHPAETYELSAAMVLDRSLLLSGGQTQVLIRPRLSMTGVPIDPSIIQDGRVSIASTDLDGVTSTQETARIEWTQQGEMVVPYRVPERLADVTVTLTGSVKPLTDAQVRPLSTSQSWNIAGVRKTRNVHDAYLTRDRDTYVIEVRGRNGEIVPGAIVSVSMSTRFRNSPVEQMLQAGAAGRVRLGDLANVETITFAVSGGISHTQRLGDYRTFWAAEVFTTIGRAIELPWFEPVDRASSRFRLVAMDGGQVRSDETQHVSIRNGFLTITDLPAGDFRLIDRQTGDSIVIAVVDGPVIDEVAVGENRHRTLNTERPISIANVDRNADGLTIKLSGQTELARVHLYARRYFEQADPAAALDLPMPGMTGRSVRRDVSGYVSDLRLGDEYQYVLRRRYASKFPGVMLPQPGLILNPWETEETTNQSQSADVGQAVPPTAAVPLRQQLERQRRESKQAPDAVASDFDFVADPGVIVANLRPDENGVVNIPADVIDGMPILQIVVCDPTTVISQTVAGPLVDCETRDLRLAKTLDLKTAYSMEQSVLVASPDSPLDLQILGSAQVQTIGSVTSLFKLYKTLVNDSRLDDFDVLARWDGLDKMAKTEAYSRLASHELHVFLWAHDRAFFDEVVTPYLANKKEKQFVDHWLLGDDLSSFTSLWRYNRLNAAEQAMLAMRVPDVRETVQRQLREVVANRDVDHAAIRLGFESALSVRFGRDDDSDGTLMEMGEPFGDASVTGNMLFFGGGSRVEKPRIAAGKAMSNGAATLPDLKEWESLSRRRLGRSTTGFFRELDTTRQWAESHWDRVQSVPAPSSSLLIDANLFWADLSTRSSDEIALSTHLLRPIDSRHSALMALALCGLPITAGDIDLPSKPGDPYQPAHSVAVVTKRLVPLSVAETPTTTMIGGRFVRADDSDASDVHEFVAGVVYRGQAVLSNPTSQERTVNVMWQIPAGSIPVAGTRSLDSRIVAIKPFAVDAITYEFYFPTSGRFDHYPSTVASGETLLAQADAETITVLDEPKEDNDETWPTIARTGTPDRVASFLKTANVRLLDWDLIVHRMNDQDIYQVVVGALDTNKLAISNMWAYSFKHRDEPAIRNFLSVRDDLVGSVGPVLESSLLSVDPIDRQTHEMLEYSPLVLARIHRLGDIDEILNSTLMQQYRGFLRTLAYSREIAPKQHLTLAYYLLIQNRIAESIAAFEKVDRGDVATKLQYDYMDAYLALHRGDHDRAAKIASANANHPMPRWNARFTELQSHLDQYRDLNETQKIVSKGDPKPDANDIGQGTGDLAIIDQQTRQSNAANESPEVIVRVEGNKLRIDHRRTDSATLNLYGVDLELLFSKAPFVREDLARMAMVRPLASESLAFDDSNGVATFDLTDDQRRQTLLVEVVSGASRSTALSYGGNLTTYVSEAMGQLQTTNSETRRPIIQAYVKVYAKYPDGGVRFYKDGYTDARGRFDYVSLSADDAKGATRFAVLVLSDEQGATLHDVAPPTR